MGKLTTLMMLVWMASGLLTAEQAGQNPGEQRKELLAELKSSGFKIIYESCRDDNWELMLMNADGSSPVNITQTPDVHELVPRISPNGKQVVFVAEQVEKGKQIRDVYYMNIDGTDCVRVGRNNRQPFWCPDGKRIGYMRGAGINYGEGGSANKELYFYDIETGKHVRHPKQDISGLLNPCISSDGKWIISSVMGGMGFAHSIVAIEADGMKLIELARSHSEAGNVYQCRPDISPDSRHIAWGKEDAGNHYGLGANTMFVEIGDIDLSSPEPTVTNRRPVVTVKSPEETYHVDWSPDGRYIAYSHGSRGGRMAQACYVVGAKAKGWDILVVKPSVPDVAVQLTHDGLSNKEPDWAPK